jgi:hypothetical protein
MEVIKVISVLEPWASLVELNKKKFETRSWATKYRGPLGIHSSAGHSPWHMNLAWQEPFYMALQDRHVITQGKPGIRYNWGCILAVATLKDCLKVVKHDLVYGQPAAIFENGGWVLKSSDEYAFGDYSVGRFVWVLDDIIKLDKPIPAKGRLGLWEYDLTA